MSETYDSHAALNQPSSCTLTHLLDCRALHPNLQEILVRVEVGPSLIDQLAVSSDV